MRLSVSVVLGIVAIASLLSASTADAQSKARPKAPLKTKPAIAKTEPAAPPATVAAVEPGSVQVTGEVVMPSKIPLEGAALPVLEALQIVGGLTRSAGDEVIISHRPKDGAAPEFVTINRQDLEQGKAGLNLALQDGDIINVPVVKRYYITGNVKNPGSYPLHNGTTVAQAILLAGGLTDRGSNKGITINRAPNTQSLRAVKMDAGPDDKVQPNDEITVPSR